MATYMPPQRSPWESFLPQMAQSMFSNLMQQNMWKERFGKEQEAQTARETTQRTARRQEAGWEPGPSIIEKPIGARPGMPGRMQMAGQRGPTALQPPKPQMINIEGERFLQQGTKLTHIPKADLTNWDKDYALLASGKITPDQFFAARGMGPKTQPETFGDLEFHKDLNAYIQKGTRGTVRKFTKEGWKPLTEEEKTRVAKAGAPSMTQIIQGEKFGLGKRISASERRRTLLESANKKDIFDAEADDFNVMSPNEVAYWDPSPRKWARDGITKFTKLSKKNISDGWTPAKVQEFAETNNLTTYEVLRRIGAIK